MEADALVTEVVERLAARYGLTLRETEVLHLLARGRTNPAISEQLFIKRSTTDTHVKTVLHKLTIGRRNQLAALLLATSREKG